MNDDQMREVLAQEMEKHGCGTPGIIASIRAGANDSPGVLAELEAMRRVKRYVAQRCVEAISSAAEI